jgi:hypothetical protein
MSDRSTLRVSNRTWHGRLYAFWRRNAVFKKGGYRENLCHYVRVILFWGPLAVFIHWAPFKRARYVTPCSVLTALVATVGIVWATIVYPSSVLSAVLTVLAITAAVAAGAFGINYLDNHEDDIVNWWKSEGRGVRQIRAVGRFFAAIGSAVSRFLMFTIFKLPVGLYLGVLAVALGSIFGDILVLVWTLVTLVTIGVLILAAVVGEKVSQKRRNRIFDLTPKDEGIVRVGARFVVAKKHKICPFIEVEGG